MSETYQKSGFYYANQGRKKFKRRISCFSRKLQRKLSESFFYDNETGNCLQFESGMFCSITKNYLPLFLIVKKL